MQSEKKAMLVIMDGWGLNPDPTTSAIAAANTPFIDSLYQTVPNTTLLTFGDHVGLPDDQMGNSEVGHMNLGAGRIVWQDLLLIQKKIESKEFFSNPTLLSAFEHARSGNKALHLFGLVSDGGIHSHIDHVKALIQMAADNGVKKIFVHAFTDGRDTDPKSGLSFILDLETFIADKPCKIASVCGRYYAMDRDKRWERVKKAYDAMVSGIGKPFSKASEAIALSYDEGVTDEFILPAVMTDDNGKPFGIIEEGDVVISFNFRTDRCREITEVLTQTDKPEFSMKKLSLYYVTMTIYDEKFKNVEVVYGKDCISNTLGEVIANAGKTQLRMAETEKYPHVTFFFSGGREVPFEGESRIMMNSPKVATYDLQPEMSAFLLKDALIEKMKQDAPDFICLNFANTDMVGHTGVFEAGIKAAETVDTCVQEVVKQALSQDYTVFLTADHGNADLMVNPDGSPNTAHTKNLVPLFVIDNHYKGVVKKGKLADIAPSILHVMGIPIPSEMTGEILIA